jgi:hypothetical protein
VQQLQKEYRAKESSISPKRFEFYKKILSFSDVVETMMRNFGMGDMLVCRLANKKLLDDKIYEIASNNLDQCTAITESLCNLYKFSDGKGKEEAKEQVHSLKIGLTLCKNDSACLLYKYVRNLVKLVQDYRVPAGSSCATFEFKSQIGVKSVYSLFPYIVR